MIREFLLRLQARRWARQVCRRIDRGDLVGAATMGVQLFHPEIPAEQARQCGQMAADVLGMNAEDARTLWGKASIVLATMMGSARKEG